mmetsp:Transcript_13148/g.22344  ORF Transcript_13148/g.22344 Transcript_13148/m.22344 type:complete len:138 (-) Transcript_13148:112-525(-)
MTSPPSSTKSGRMTPSIQKRSSSSSSSFFFSTTAVVVVFVVVSVLTNDDNDIDDDEGVTSSNDDDDDTTFVVVAADSIRKRIPLLVGLRAILSTTMIITAPRATKLQHRSKNFLANNRACWCSKIIIVPLSILFSGS